LHLGNKNLTATDRPALGFRRMKQAATPAFAGKWATMNPALTPWVYVVSVNTCKLSH
jgi:hypothetical protein